MKFFYLFCAALLMVVILILGFSNVSAQCSGLNFFFYQVSSFPPALLFFGLSAIGMLTGICIAGFFGEMMKESEQEENGGDW
jgi:uncharacterized integral membrane protein